MTPEERHDMVAYRLTNARNTLKEVDLLIQNQLWNGAVNRLYYACFYAVGALLLYNNIPAKTHSGTRQMFGLNFVDTGIISKETGRYYAALFERRQKDDYEDLFDHDEQTLSELLPPAHEMIRQIEALLGKTK